MAEPPSDLPEFDRIVDDVLAGKRSFAFWPGTGAVVTVITLHVLALSIWLGPTFFGAVPWLKRHFDAWPVVLPVVLLAAAASVITSGVLIARGAASGRTILRRITIAWGSVVFFSAIVAALGLLQAPIWPYVASGAGLALAFRLQSGLNFVIYATFQQRMRARLVQRKAAARPPLADRRK